MFTRSKALLGITTAAVLITSISWAASETPSDDSAAVSADVEVASTTVVQVEDAGTVTLGRVIEGLSILAVTPAEGWTVTVEVPVGREVETSFKSAGARVDFTAELEDGEVRVRVERGGGSATTTSTAAVTSSTGTPTTSTSSTTPASTSTSTSTSTTEATTSTTQGTTSTTGPTSTSSTTSTTIDDNDRRSSIRDGVQVFEAKGAGSVTVDIHAGRLILLTVAVEPGWSFGIKKAEADDIRIEFEGSGDAEAELRVRVRDGRLEVESRRR